MDSRGARAQHQASELEVSDSSVKFPWTLEPIVTSFKPCETDSSISAPQVVFETAPEIQYDSFPPEAISGVEVLRAENIKEASLIGSRICGLSKKVFWVLSALVILAVAIIGIGVGIKVGAFRNAPKPPVPKSMEHRILNGTSLATISLYTKDRYLFFQDHSGIIRQAVRKDSNNEWTTISSIVASDAKNYTPLAVAPANSPDSSEAIYLFYITSNHTVASVAFISGVWTSSSEDITGLSRKTAALNSNYLSASRMLNNLPHDEILNGLSNGPSEEMCLLYENLNGKVTMLIGKVVHVDTNRTAKWTWEWDDISDKLSSSLPDAQFGPPFRSSSSHIANISAIEVVGRDTTVMINQNGDPVQDRFLTSVYTSKNKTISSDIYPNSYDKAIEQSDIVTVTGRRGFGLWVRDQKLAFLYTGGIARVQLLESLFPFARLASSFRDFPTLHLYHQLNGSTFVEDQWDASISAWVETTHIHISDD